MIEFLLDKVHDINARDNDGYTPLERGVITSNVTISDVSYNKIADCMMVLAKGGAENFNRQLSNINTPISGDRNGRLLLIWRMIDLADWFLSNTDSGSFPTLPSIDDEIFLIAEIVKEKLKSSDKSQRLERTFNFLRRSKYLETVTQPPSKLLAIFLHNEDSIINKVLYDIVDSMGLKASADGRKLIIHTYIHTYIYLYQTQ